MGLALLALSTATTVVAAPIVVLPDNNVLKQWRVYANDYQVWDPIIDQAPASSECDENPDASRRGSYLIS